MPTVMSSISASGSTFRPYFSLRARTRWRASFFWRKPCFVGSTPRMMLSSTEKHSTSLKCWWTMPMPSALASLGSLMDTSTPSFLMMPSSGWYRPNSTLISVDLPAPFSPSRAWISPFFTCKVMSSLAMIPGNRFVMCSISMAYGVSKFSPSLPFYGPPLTLCAGTETMNIFSILYFPA